MSKKVKATKNLAKDVKPKLAKPQNPNHRTALQYLDNIVSLAPISRQGHIQAQQALQQLGGAITELELRKKDKP